MNAIDPRCFASSTINIITTSGGKDSLAQWLRAIENDVPHISVFADTGHEHPQTIEYLDYLESKLGKIIRVKADFTRQIEGKRKFIAEKWPISLVEECGMSTDEAEERIYRALEILKPTGVPFLDLCMWKGRFPSTKARFCTFELKHEPIRTQVIDPALDEYDEVISWQGVRGQESPERALLPEWEDDADNTLGLHVYRPILNWLHEDVFAIAKRHGIKPNPFICRDAVVSVVCHVFMLASQNLLRFSNAGQKKSAEWLSGKDWLRNVQDVAIQRSFHPRMIRAVMKNGSKS